MTNSLGFTAVAITIAVLIFVGMVAVLVTVLAGAADRRRIPPASPDDHLPPPALMRLAALARRCP